MELDEQPTWEDIKKIKNKLDSLDDMERDDPEFKIILKECERELNLAWDKIIKTKFKDSILMEKQ